MNICSPVRFPTASYIDPFHPQNNYPLPNQHNARDSATGLIPIHPEERWKRSYLIEHSLLELPQQQQHNSILCPYGSSNADHFSNTAPQKALLPLQNHRNLFACDSQIVKLLLHGLWPNQACEYINALVGNHNYEIIIDAKNINQDTTVVFMKDYSAALRFIDTINSKQRETSPKAVLAAITADEISWLESCGHFCQNTENGAIESHPHQTTDTVKGSKTSRNVALSQDQAPNQKQNGSVKRSETGIKVFVGCLPKTASEAALTEIFSEFGKVLDAHILRDNNANTKFSAFVYFETMEMALHAIKHLDRLYTMPNGKRPIEVRLAEKRGLRVPRTKDAATSAPWGQEKLYNGATPNLSVLDKENIPPWGADLVGTRNRQESQNFALSNYFENFSRKESFEQSVLLEAMERTEYYE